MPVYRVDANLCCKCKCTRWFTTHDMFHNLILKGISVDYYCRCKMMIPSHDVHYCGVSDDNIKNNYNLNDPEDARVLHYLFSFAIVKGFDCCVYPVEQTVYATNA